MSNEKACDSLWWYAIYTHPMQEDRAASNLQSWQVETFSPKLKESRYNQYTGKPTYLSKPLFPRYIFARFKASHLLHKIRFTRGVHSVVSSGDDPTPISDEVVTFIQSQIGEDGFARIGEELKPGDRVIIKNGSLKSLTGIFEREMKATHRVMILLTAVNYQGHILIEKGLVSKISNQFAAHDC
ncbi:MAG: transcription termination/antitermination protein NusG [Pyrinomonadaceae bacterium]